MKKVVLIIGGLAMIAVGILVAWSLIFDEGALLETSWSAMRDIFNGFFGGIFGSDSEFIQDYAPEDDGSDSMDVTNPF